MRDVRRGALSRGLQDLGLRPSYARELRDFGIVAALHGADVAVKARLFHYGMSCNNTLAFLAKASGRFVETFAYGVNSLLGALSYRLRLRPQSSQRRRSPELLFG